MPSGESRGGLAPPTRSKLCVVKPLLLLRVLRCGFLQSQNQAGLRLFRGSGPACSQDDPAFGWRHTASAFRRSPPRSACPDRATRHNRPWAESQASGRGRLRSRLAQKLYSESFTRSGIGLRNRRDRNRRFHPPSHAYNDGMKDLKNRVALVTGGSRGIGAAVAIALGLVLMSQ